MSVSRIRDSDADRFSTATLRLLIVCSKRFWYAPSEARESETDSIALSIEVIAASGSLVRSRAAVPSLFESTEPIAMLIFWLAFAPTWNAPLLPPVSVSVPRTMPRPPAFAFDPAVRLGAAVRIEAAAVAEASTVKAPAPWNWKDVFNELSVFADMLIS